MTVIEDIIVGIEKSTLLCYQCSKCNSVCPAFRIEQFSPRTFVLGLMNDGLEGVASDPQIWGCRSCGACKVCPMEIDIPFLVIQARIAANKIINPPPKTKIGHKQIFNLAQRIQANNPSRPVGNKWILNHQRFTESGPVVFYAGILPSWDSLMYSFDLNLTVGLQGILEALNATGLEPAVPAGLKDSGHDMFYSGEETDFLKLARYNHDMLQKVGAETIIVANPEDYYMLKKIYPMYLDGFDYNVVFWTDYLVEHDFLENLRAQAYLDVEIIATYHDPCKLGRGTGIYDSPRIILENLPGVRVRELHETRELAHCCGVTAFIGCDEGSLYLRKERLAEAKGIGCDVLVTTCPSCVSHYTCALGSGQEIKEEDKDNGGEIQVNRPPFQVMDLATLMGVRLYRFQPTVPME